MKKTFLRIISFVILISLFSTSCYATSSNYSSDYDQLIFMVSTLGDTANAVAQINVALWEEVGPSDVAKYIEHVLYIGQYGDSQYQGTYSLKQIKKVLGQYDYLTTTKFYYDAVDFLKRYTEATKILIKMSRDQYPEHSNSFKALQEYYIKAAAYADIALNPSGNLINYRASRQQFQKELQELKLNAEFEK